MYSLDRMLSFPLSPSLLPPLDSRARVWTQLVAARSNETNVPGIFGVRALDQLWALAQRGHLPADQLALLRQELEGYSERMELFRSQHLDKQRELRARFLSFIDM